MLRNEALAKVKHLEGMLNVPGTILQNGRGNVLDIARELVDLLKEEDLPAVEPLEVIATGEAHMKNITDPAVVDPAKRETFLKKLSCASQVYRGLEAALEDLTKIFAEEYDIKTKFNSIGEQKVIDRKIGYLLFRCTKLLLTNAEMRPGVTTLTITLENRGEDVLISIEDDGVGFNTNDTKALMEYAKNEKVTRIREWVQYVKGRLYVMLQKDRGTRVTTIVPQTITR